ncbi:hypothetical protein XaCFBP7622_01695 [Xanthomonas arboricola]|nr:hypothetical protein XaCFBP7622_01695 [Xanthomonas arboricola]
MGRARGALAARGTRRKPFPGGSVSASMPPYDPATGEHTASESWSVIWQKSACCSGCIGRLIGGDAPNNTRHVLLTTLRADHLDWSLPAYRRGTLRGMDAA